MSVELADRFHSLSADDRRAVEVIATSELVVSTISAPHSREAWILRKAMDVVAKMKPEATQQEAKP